MKRVTIGLCTVTVLGAASVALAADCDDVYWCDNFDNYLVDIAVVGQDECGFGFTGCPDDLNGCVGSGAQWTGWDANPNAAQSPVLDEQSLSAPHSVGILGGNGHSGSLSDDLVHTYNAYNINSGVHQYSADLYLPNGYTGNHYFILLNQYSNGGTKNWSTQVHWDAPSGQIISDFDDGVQNEVPFVTGEWGHIQVIINLDNDSQIISWNDQVIINKSWSGGVGGQGTTTLQAVDLFGNDASLVYYDNLELCTVLPFGACCLEDGSCLDDNVVEEDCDAIAHAKWQGIGSSCNAVDCPVRIAGRGWQVDPSSSPGGPGALFIFSDDTCLQARQDCDETGTGSFDEQFEVTIPWSQDWTFEICGASFNSLETGSLVGPCGADDFSDDDCGDDGTITKTLAQNDVYFVTVEGLSSSECGTYDFVVKARCPDIVRDPNAINNDGPACFDGDTDPVNIGCNADPGQETFSDMLVDGVYAGTVGNFILDGNGRRDLDWYKTIATGTSIDLSLIGQGPSFILFWGTLAEELGNECSDNTILQTSTTGGCGDTAAISRNDLVIGDWYTVIVAHDFADPEDIPCGDLSYYEVTVTGLSGECPCPGDANGDCVVNFADILVILGNWGDPENTDIGDLTGEGDVDFADILVVLGNWGCTG